MALAAILGSSGMGPDADASSGARRGAAQKNQPRTLAVVGVVAAIALLAGCGRAVPSSNGGPTTVTVRPSKLGRFLVDGEGHSLYLFVKDAKDKSSCGGACASVWPPLETNGSIHAAGGVSAAGLRTFKRDDGTLQVSYDGHPLYYFAGDGSEPGKTSGAAIVEFGAVWYLVQPNGDPLATTKRGGSSSP